MIVIKKSNLPTRLPVLLTAVVYLLLDRFHPADWVWGAVGAVFVLVWIGAFVAWFKEDEVDIFENPENLQGKFLDRLQKTLEKIICVKKEGKT
jgi:hypothetical protein